MCSRQARQARSLVACLRVSTVLALGSSRRISVRVRTLPGYLTLMFEALKDFHVQLQTSPPADGDQRLDGNDIIRVATWSSVLLFHGTVVSQR